VSTCDDHIEMIITGCQNFFYSPVIVSLRIVYILYNCLLIICLYNCVYTHVIITFYEHRVHFKSGRAVVAPTSSVFLGADFMFNVQCYSYLSHLCIIKLFIVALVIFLVIIRINLILTNVYLIILSTGTERSVIF